MTTTTMSEFIFEDSEIPDLVLEAIIGFLAELTPVEKWGDIRCVSKRWNRISKPVLKEAFKNTWPKFTLPKNRLPSDFIRIDAGRRHASAKVAQDYVWAFTEPLSLRSVIGSKAPVGVEFFIPDNTSIYLAVMLVHSRNCKTLFERELHFCPFFMDEKLREDGDLFICAIGACSGTVIIHDLADSTAGTMIKQRSNEVFEIVYHPGIGEVEFFVERKLQDKGYVSESAMISKNPDAVIVFGAAFSSHRSATLRPRLSSH